MQQIGQKICPAATQRLYKLYENQLDLENVLQTRFTWWQLPIQTLETWKTSPQLDTAVTWIFVF